MQQCTMSSGPQPGSAQKLCYKAHNRDMTPALAWPMPCGTVKPSRWCSAWWHMHRIIPGPQRRTPLCRLHLPPGCFASARHAGVSVKLRVQAVKLLLCVLMRGQGLLRGAVKGPWRALSSCDAHLTPGGQVCRAHEAAKVCRGTSFLPGQILPAHIRVRCVHIR